MTTLYHHKTDGGAEYLCTSPIEGTNEGDLQTAIIRLDGQPELLSSKHAAAHELLDALQDILNALQKARTVRAPAGHYDEDVYYNGIDIAPQIDQAREVIAKATE